MIRGAVIAVCLFIAIAALFKFFTGADQGLPSIEQGVKIVKPLDLNGEWKSTNPNVIATVQNGTIEVQNILEGGGYARWWFGTFDNPQDGKVGVISKGIEDPDKFYLSSAETKEFVYDNGMLKFQISTMGVSEIVEMKRV
jgi:hypothetical protein